MMQQRDSMVEFRLRLSRATDSEINRAQRMACVMIVIFGRFFGGCG